ncbi:MAG: DNA repair protein RecN [Aerococcus sp.]|nr:DNA repair protein RecN [Aerococcus sp.]
MLQNLTIENFAIIDHLTVDFDDGMTVLTGETGAGKSIIIDAVGLLVGGRGSTEFIRYGTDSFHLSGLFFMPALDPAAHALLEEWHIPFTDQQLEIRRDLEKNGRNTIKVNGVALTVASLKRLGRYIVDIHGQNEHQTLMDPKSHLHFLDQYGGEKIAQALLHYQEEYQAYRTLQHQYQAISLDDQASAQRIDLLTFQIDEIEQSQIVVGEEDELLSEREQLQNYQQIVEALTAATEGLMQGSTNAYDLVGTLASSLSHIATLDPKYNQFYQEAESIYYNIEGLSGDIAHALDGLSYDPNRLNAIEDRLALLQNLKRKYGADEAEIIAYVEQARLELNELTHQESRQQELQQAMSKQGKRLKMAARALHEVRVEQAESLSQAVDQQLTELYMQKAHFQVHFEERRHFQNDGKDEVVFYLSTNQGEPFKPLHKIASGGEMSRIMLAMKAIFQQAQGVTAIIFDEVDTGVSGRVAQAIANKMYRISLATQVLCISHLPQVAAMADQQLLIQKQETEGRTRTAVETLDVSGRVEQIARMSAGEIVSAATRAAAEEQLASAALERKQLASAHHAVGERDHHA